MKRAIRVSTLPPPALYTHTSPTSPTFRQLLRSNDDIDVFWGITGYGSMGSHYGCQLPGQNYVPSVTKIWILLQKGQEQYQNIFLNQKVLLKTVVCPFIPFYWCDKYVSLKNLTLSPWTKWSQFISQTIFSHAFSWMKSFVFWLKINWSLFLRVQLTIFQHWFRL